MACEYCNNCKHATCHIIKSDIYEERKNWYCGHGKTKVLLDLTTEKDKLIYAPDWCPLAKEQSSNGANDYKVTYKSTPYEIRDQLKKVKGFSSWDDIKVNQVYHLPPLLDGDKRRDILITAKSQYNMSYKVLNDNCSYQINTFYPSSLEVKFLVPHKIMHIEIVNNGVR